MAARYQHKKTGAFKQGRPIIGRDKGTRCGTAVLAANWRKRSYSHFPPLKDEAVKEILETIAHRVSRYVQCCVFTIFQWYTHGREDFSRNQNKGFVIEPKMKTHTQHQIGKTMTALVVIFFYGAGCHRSASQDDDTDTSSDVNFIDTDVFFYPQLSLGAQSTCILDETGRVECWGANQFGQSLPPDDRFKQIAAGVHHVCGIRYDDTVKCWGDNADNQIDAPQNAFFKIASGQNFSCGIRPSGSIECWGGNDGGQLDAPQGVFAELDVHYKSACALSREQLVYCWGYLAAEDRKAPPSDERFTDVAVGFEEACGLTSNGDVICWGNGEIQGRVSGGDISELLSAYCGLLQNRTLECWGFSPYLEIAVPDVAFYSVSGIGGRGHACGITTDDEIICWGDNERGETTLPDVTALAMDSNVDRTCEVLSSGQIVCQGGGLRFSAPPGSDHLAVSLGTDFICALNNDQSLNCIGVDKNGNTIPPDGSFSSLKTEKWHSCVIDKDGGVQCWPTSYDSAPTANAIDVDVGDGHGCALLSDGTIQCFGLNDLNQADAPLGEYTQITSAGNHNCAISAKARESVCWGDNEFRQLAAEAGPFTFLSAFDYSYELGEQHTRVSATCGVLENGTLRCWGALTGYFGGGILPISSVAPFDAFPNNLNLRLVAPSVDHICGIQQNNTIVCWGDIARNVRQSDFPSRK